MDSVAFLRQVYPTLENGQKEQLAQVVDELKFLQDENGKLRAQAEAGTLPEAPTSANARVVDPETQMEWQVTIRGYATGQMVTSLIAGIKRAETELMQNGFISFDAYVDQRKAERQAGSGQNGSQGQPTAPPMANGNGQSQPAHERQETFEAAELAATINNGKAYWKVKGGKYTRFGVTVWPEVLQAAGFVDDLDPMSVYSLKGWTATVVFKDDGKVDKVTRLEQ